MKIRLKKFLNKYKNRIFSFIAVIACIPLLSISSFAFTVPISSMPICPDAGALAGIYVSDGFEGYVEISTNYDYGEFSYEFHNDVDMTSVGAFEFWISPGFNPSFNLEVYDYYLAFNIYFSDIRSYLFVDTVNVYAPKVGAANDSEQSFDLLDVRTGNGYFFDDEIYDNVVTVVGRIPDDYNSLPISDILLICSDGRIYASQYNEITAFLYQVPKGTDEEVVNNLIDAINNQTDVLGGYINNGNDSTGGIVSGNNSAIDDLDEVVSEYHATEQQFFDDFNSNQQAITSDIVGWSWGGLVNCANWVGETLTDYYNNMGDFRQFIIYPLMLGIALFFLGRGGSIIGHLFRKPTETTVNTKSVFRREGNTKYTSTTTSRQGGVFRK